MSGQRYVPDNRYPRDRTPPRQGDRYQPPPYAGRSDYSSGSLPSRRDVPRGPKALVEPSRSYSSGSFPTRGRSYPPRTESRGDYRDPPRESRRSPSRETDRDRPYRDRDADRRTPPRGKPPIDSTRESQDLPPREGDGSRVRRDSADVPESSYAYDQRSSRSIPSSRGGRIRGRDSWDRDRRRDSGQSERDQFRARSRSREPDRAREERDIDTRDDYAEERDLRDRESARIKRDQYTASHDSRRPSVTSTASTTPRLGGYGPSPSQAGGRPSNDDRDYFTQRRMSNVNPPATPRDGRAENSRTDFPSGRTETSRDRYTTGPPSPPPVPQVPAFGGAWNVWKAPADSKPTQQPSTSSIAPSTSTPTGPKVAPTAMMLTTERQPPRGPRADRDSDLTGGVEEQRSSIPSAKTERSDNEPLIAPSKSPEQKPRDAPMRPPDPSPRDEIPFLKSPPTKAKQLTMLGPRNDRPNKPAFSSNAHNASKPSTGTVPSGPRAAPTFTSPNTIGLNIPTGPKADRIHSQPPLTAPTGPSAGPSSSWQWSRSGASSQPSRSASMLPLKRDLNGDGKNPVDLSDRGGDRDMSQMSSGRLSYGPTQSPSLQHDTRRPTRTGYREEFEVAYDLSEKLSQADTEQNLPETAESIKGEKQSAPEDSMDLDEDDFGDNEAKFQREKAHLETKKADLSHHALRGTQIAQKLVALSRIKLRGVSHLESGKFTSRLNDSYTRRDHLLTPKAEENEDSEMADPQTPPRLSPPPVSSPELRALPFLNNGPPTPIEDLDFFKENITWQNALKEELVTELSKRKDDEHAIEDQLREEYIRIYRPWRKHCERLDEEVQQEREKEEHVPVETIGPPVVQETIPAATTPLAESRRTRGTFTSEYIVEQVMKESVESAIKEQQKRDREALSAKPDFNKEAVIPPLMSGEDQRRHLFVDTSHLREPEDAIVFYRFEPPRDDFTEEEHQILVQNFKEYPKKWSKLAQALPGRSYKDVINHYYATKWNKEFKPPKDRRAKKSTKGRLAIRPNGSLRPKSNALISGLGGLRPDLYEGDEFSGPVYAVTDKGRPRRAAAPTFGDKEADEQSTNASTPARKGGKTDSGAEASAEKAGKRSRVQNKEKSQRKPRNPHPTRQSASPEKTGPENGPASLVMQIETDLNPRELEVANGLAVLHTGQALPGSRPINSDFDTSVDPSNGNDSRRVANSQTQRPMTSSYWSVHEVSAFPRLLEHYGTDWHSISNQMGSKSHTMVKNYYMRLVKGGERPDLEEKAANADDKKRRGENIGPPPVVSQTMPRGRRNDADPNPVPRNIMPIDAMEVDERSSPQRSRSSNTVLPGQAQMSSTLSAVPQGTSYGQFTSGVPQAVSVASNPRLQSFNQSIVALPDQRRVLGASETRLEATSPIQQNKPLPQEAFASYPRDNRPSQAAPVSSQATWHIQSPVMDQRQAPRSSYDQVRSDPPPQRGEALRPQYLQSGPPVKVQSGETSLPEEGGSTSQQLRPFEPLHPARAQPPLDMLNRPRHPVVPFSEAVRHPHMSPPQAEAARLPPQPLQPGNGTSSAPKPEPRKSNLLAILNADPEPPRAPKPASSQAQHSPPGQHYHTGPPPPARPLSQPERKEIFGDPGRHGAHASPPYPPQTSVPQSSSSTRLYPEIGQREAPLRMNQPEWSSIPGQSSLHGQPQHTRAHEHGLDVHSALHPRPSLQTLNQPPNPSPPPTRLEYSREPAMGPRMNPSPPTPTRYDFHRDGSSVAPPRSQSQSQANYAHSGQQPPDATRSLQPNPYAHGTPPGTSQHRSPQSQHGPPNLLDYRTHQRQSSDGHSRLDSEYRSRPEQRYREDQGYMREHRARADPFYPSSARDQPAQYPPQRDDGNIRDHRLSSEAYSTRPTFGPITADTPRDRDGAQRTSLYGSNEQSGRPASTPTVSPHASHPPGSSNQR